MASRVGSSKVKGKPLKVMWGRIQEVFKMQIIFFVHMEAR
jgi:hypothetical protein